MNDVRILQADPKASYLGQKESIDKAISAVLENGRYILGPEVERFEEEFASYVGMKHCISVANGTDAIEIALRALGIGPGDEVITVSHTAVATVAAIDLVGATPVLIDIDPETFTLDCNCMEETLKSRRDRVRAIIPVHLYGHPAEMSSVMATARAFDLRVVEDCSQAHGARYQGSQVGTFGDIATFSFYPTKNLGAIGDGGAVLTNCSDLAERAEALRQYGWKERYVSASAGMNTRLDELQAAILRVKLRNLTAGNERRRTIAALFANSLGDMGLRLPGTMGWAEHVFHQYVVRSHNRESLRHHLGECGIGTAVHYPVPVHLQSGYSDRIRIGSGGMQQTEQVCQEILSLPIYPELADQQIQAIVEGMCSWVATAQ